MKLAIGMIVIGAILAIIGGVTMATAGGELERARSAGAFASAYSGGATNGQAAIDAAQGKSGVGLGVLVAGAVVAVLGVTVVAVKSK